MTEEERPAILKTAYGAELAYHRLPAKDSDKPGVVFLGGFKSDMTGSKAMALEALCRELGLGFLRFDYRGHGQSSDRFEDGTIGDWATDSITAIRDFMHGPQVLVGSSMGGWMMLLAALALPQRIAGMVGIAAAPDFTETLIWEQLSPEERQAMQSEGVYHAPSCYDDEDPYPITYRLITEARDHLLMQGEAPLPITCPVHLVQGMRDEDVPWQTAIALAEKLAASTVRITLVKEGDHRMSTPEALPDVLLAVSRMVEEVSVMPASTLDMRVSGT